ncbi:MAG: helix-turn-helix transcriptional regulator [Sandaracinaceae bacterium]|nr:helix-turn-helix transcriptional regulator [Sandaracinaceae bacterium]
MLRRRQAPAPPVERLDLRGGVMELRVEGLAPDRPLRVDTTGVMILFPLRTSVIEADVRGQTIPLDRTHWGLAPTRSRVRLRARTPGARVLLATAHPPLFDHVVELYRKVHLDGARYARWRAEPQLLPRTVWVDEIVQRYLFERQVCEGFENDATRFLEAEIVKEAYYLLRDRDEGADRASLVQRHSPTIDKALAHVEAHLFEPASIPALARVAGASESTLLRAFKRELGCTPSAYWRMRRLDEALVLLEAGHQTVAEIAAVVGYENASAFAHAFALRFGRAPSELLPR